MKVVLAIMVVGIHLRFLQDVSPYLSYLLCNGLFRIAVPIFLLVNGYYFFSVVERRAWREWFKRIICLYAVWMLVYLPFWLDFTPSIHSVIRFGHSVVFGYHHLWYLPGMLGAAGLVWIASGWSGRHMLMMCVSLFSLGLFLQYAGMANVFQGHVDRIIDKVWIYRNAVFLAFPFFGVGYLIARGRFEERVTVVHALAATLAGLALLLTESSLLFEHAPSRPLDVLASLALVCPAVFVLVKKSRFVGGGKSAALMASGVYFTHVLAIHLLGQTNVTDSLSRAAFVLLASLILAASLVPVNRKLKFVL